MSLVEGGQYRTECKDRGPVSLALLLNYIRSARVKVQTALLGQPILGQLVKGNYQTIKSCIHLNYVPTSWLKTPRHLAQKLWEIPDQKISHTIHQNYHFIQLLNGDGVEGVTS